MRSAFLIVLLWNLYPVCFAQQPASKKPASLNVLAYYSGNAKTIDDYQVEKLTHIIYSFLHLRNNRFSVDNAGDTAAIKKLVSLKKKNPSLKIMLALGGWGGCQPCSDVFNTETGRKEFAQSVKEVNDYFKTDGIDLDWEYPTIEGYPGHAYRRADKQNFTALVKELRKVLGKNNEISFAAGGFDQFLEESVEWDQLAPLIDRVNIMSYDLVSGFSKVTGHHTPLYSTPRQKQSADNAIRFLIASGFPANKLVIGAAFYARTWENKNESTDGIYQEGEFRHFIAWKNFSKQLGTDSGYLLYRDSIALAPFAYNAHKKMFATFEDEVSIAAKTRYAMDKGLNGIMFWELTLDKPKDGLLDAIDKERHTSPAHVH